MKFLRSVCGVSWVGSDNHLWARVEKGHRLEWRGGHGFFGVVIDFRGHFSDFFSKTK